MAPSNSANCARQFRQLLVGFLDDLRVSRAAEKQAAQLSSPPAAQVLNLTLVKLAARIGRLSMSGTTMPKPSGGFSNCESL